MSAHDTALGIEPKPKYARAADTAKHLCIGKSTLWQWCGSGPGARPGFPKPIKAGPKVSLFNLTAIESYLNAQAEKVGL